MVVLASQATLIATVVIVGFVLLVLVIGSKAGPKASQDRAQKEFKSFGGFMVTLVVVAVLVLAVIALIAASQ